MIDAFRLGAGALASVIGLVAADAHGAAFQLREGSATAIGSALAGRTANDRDVSFSIHNPATLIGVENLEVSFGGSLILPSSPGDFTLPNGAVIDSDDPAENAALPSFTVGWRALPDVVVGLAVDVPFGLATEYDAAFPSALAGVRSELVTITATPQAAWRVTPGFAIGAGVMIQYADAELSNLSPFPGQGVFDVSGEGFDVAFTFGALIEPVDGTKIGLNVQSGFEHELEGEFSSNFPFGVAGLDGKASFDLPATASVGLIQDVTEEFRVMAEFEVVRWSAFDSIEIAPTEAGAPALPPAVAVQEQNYEDTITVSVGAEYDFSDAFTVRGGVAFDESPTVDASRTQRIPDDDRYWLAVGASYEVTERIGLDVGYAYVIVEETEVTRDVAPAVIRYDDSDVHVLSANLRYRF